MVGVLVASIIKKAYNYFEVTFPNLPEEAITLARIVPIIYTDDAYNYEDITLNWTCYHSWHKVGDNYVLRIKLEGNAYNSMFQQIAVYADLNVYFLPDYSYFNVQHNRVL